MCASCGKPTIGDKCLRCRRKESDARIESRRGKGICPMCDRVPKKKGSRFCHNCGEAVKAATRGAGKRAEWRDAFRIVTWRGYGVYFTPAGEGMWISNPLPSSAMDKLPKNGGKGGEQIINLDGYAKGFDRATVQNFKKAIMKAHGLRREPCRVK